MQQLYWLLGKTLAQRAQGCSQRCTELETSRKQGFTLVELLVAAIITSVVLLIMFSAFINLLQSSRIAESKTNRRIDLSRAFDFISNEVRMATRINHTETVTVGGGNTLTDVLASAGLDNTKLGNPGQVVLYLEIPIQVAVPTTCPAGGPNAGAPPPSPASYDQVVYDIRPSSEDWLPPRSIRRYGRLPQIDGNLNPCSDPVVADTLVDAIADTTNPPTCNLPGILFGTEGFHACVNGAQVQVFLDSDIEGVSAQHSLQSRASSRVINASEPPALQINHPIGSNNVTLTWSWTGDANATFKAYQTANNATTEIYDGLGLTTTHTLTGIDGTNYCFTVVATTVADHISHSNQVCTIKTSAPPPPPPIPAGEED